MTNQRFHLSAFLMGLFFCTTGLFAAIGSWGAYRLDTGIQNSGLRAEGHVSGKSTVFAADGSDFYIEYWFNLPNGERMTGSHSIAKERWQSLHKGDKLRVFYSAQNPRRNFPEGGGVTSLGVTVFVSALGAVFAVCGALLMYASFGRINSVNDDA